MAIQDKKSQELDILKDNINKKVEHLKKHANKEDIEDLEKFHRYLNKKYANYEEDEKIDKLNEIDNKLNTYHKFIQTLESDMDIDPGRLSGLTDGIFGMVMTLLVFGIALPDIQLITSADFFIFLQSISSKIGITLVSFVLVSFFWVYHHEFIRLKNLNIPILWFHILFLACISFIPFSTSIIGNYSQFFLADFIFGVNIFLTIVFFLILFRYAYNKGFLENCPSLKEKKYIYKTFLFIMITTIIVNLLDFNVSRNFIYLFLLVPVISTIRDIKFKMDS